MPIRAQDEEAERARAGPFYPWRRLLWWPLSAGTMRSESSAAAIRFKLSTISS
jgi:hypothetical protein